MTAEIPQSAPLESRSLDGGFSAPNKTEKKNTDLNDTAPSILPPIVDALGISRNTVSKATNNSNGLADATREKILQKAIEMGYKQFSYVATLSGSGVPSFAPADPLEQSGAVGEIAVFTGTRLSMLSNHFAVPMLDRFKQELSLLGYTMKIYKVDPEDIVRHTLPAAFVPDQVSSVMCMEIFDRPYAEMICGLGVPVLFVDGPNKRFGDPLPADQLYMDNTTGITKIVNEMVQKGKRKIGFVGDYEHCQSFFERYTAFCSAMTLAGVPVDEAFCIKETSVNMDSPLAALSELPELLICANDFIAGDVMQSLRKMGKSVPEDVLLCGFDDAPESRIMTPALTTVHIHTQIMAFTAVDLLLGRIKEPTLNHRAVYTATELIWRDSTIC